MKIEAIQQKDLHDIVRLHIQELPNTASSKIGSTYLYTMYSLFISNTSFHSSFIVKDEGRIVGVITATRNLLLTQKLFKSRVSPGIIGIILWAVIRGKITHQLLWKHYLFERGLQKQHKDSYQRILTLFVDKKFQRKGIGKTLIKKIIQEYKKNGSIYVDTLKINTGAQKFYRKYSFKRVLEIGDSIIYTYAANRKKT